MIWADKIGVLWGVVALCYMDILVKTPLVEDPSFALTLVIKLVLPVWGLLRLLDWVMDGPGKRQARRP